MKSARYIVTVSQTEPDDYKYIVSISGDMVSLVFKGEFVPAMEYIGAAIMADASEAL